MLQAESSSSLFCLWTARSLPAAPHPVSRRRSCLPLRTDQCFCPMGTFTPLLVRTLRRTFQDPSGRNRLQIRHTLAGGFAEPWVGLFYAICPVEARFSAQVLHRIVIELG